MKASEISEVIYYCENRCCFNECDVCEHKDLSSNCGSFFMLELYDVIDTKNLETNNMIDIIKETGTLRMHKSGGVAFGPLQYTIVELFVNERYKLIKKKDYKKLIDSCSRDN